MDLAPPVNPNYAATVIRVATLNKHPNADRLNIIFWRGLQAIVDLSTQVDDIGIIIPAEAQLSWEYAFENSMHSHAFKESITQHKGGGQSTRVLQMNADVSTNGYLGDNRRVRAIKLRDVRSDALFMPLSSLKFTGAKLKELKVDDTFDVLNGYEICKKYERPRKPMSMSASKEAVVRVEDRHFPKHFDTPQWFNVDRNLDPYAHCVVTQKLHGTSIRIGNVLVPHKPSLFERIAKVFGVKIKEYDFDMIYGSHKVVKDPNNPGQKHFYTHDVWTHEGQKLTDLVPKNYVVYGELIGWVPLKDENGNYSPFQKNYTYNQPEGQCEIYVYRVAIVNEDGTVADLSWGAVKEFCLTRGLKHVPELWDGDVDRLSKSIDSFLDIKFFGADEYEDDELIFKWSAAVPLSADSPCDEGVCIRIDGGIIPTIIKAKSPEFYQHETAMKDEEEKTGVINDVEAAESVA